MIDKYNQDLEHDETFCQSNTYNAQRPHYSNYADSIKCIYKNKLKWEPIKQKQQ
jgi:hypothetical protein